MNYLTVDAHKHESIHSGATFSTPAFSTPAFSVAPSELRSVASHMDWDRSVTCHPTQVNAPLLNLRLDGVAAASSLPEGAPVTRRSSHPV